MSSARVIKKYPNRRLYDTTDSRYITLSDVRDLVLGQVDFVVIDKKNGHDITRCVLLQVISERELQGDPVLSQAFLSEIIRSHDRHRSAPLSTYLEQSLSMFVNQECRGANATDGLRDASLAETAHINFTRWKARQDEAGRRLADGADEAQLLDKEQKKAS
jgi:polyhydroxyalkanoate synthesis repressor PhaR